MTSPATLAMLLQSLDRGELLLLPGITAARQLRSAYDEQQRCKGLSAWQPARAIAWQQWTSSLYTDLIVSGVETRLLLNAAQEQSIWSSVIAADFPAGNLTSTASLAELAASTFALAAAWSATARLSASATSNDTRAFARWARAFEEQCRKERLLPPAMLDATLAQHLEAGVLASPQTLRLVGFETLRPSQQSLTQTLERHGTAVERIELASADVATSHAYAAATNPREEMRLAARWLEQQLRSANPPSRIAVLVPGLDNEAAEFEAILRDTLAPELQSIDADLSSTPWHFSNGMPLHSLALVRDVLDLARWAIDPLPQGRVSALLLSPYLNPGVDRERAAQLDARLRRTEKRLRPELSLAGFLRLLDKHRSTLAWPRQFATEIARAGDLSRPRSYAAWMEFLRGVLQATGWPSSAARPLNAIEFEATRGWESVLDLVSTLDFSGERVSLRHAIAALERQTQATGFTPPSTNPPIHILRPGEAEGALFDAVLFLHATDANLPSAERMNPLLPWQLQNSLAMPGSSPTRAAAHAQASLQALLRRTSTVLFTYATEDADGKLRPSPLLAEFGIHALDAAKLDAARLAPDAPPPKMEYDRLPDEDFLPAPADRVYGGTGVLKAQSACGFRAFAEFRLVSTELESSDLGLDAQRAGRIIHHALHTFWSDVRSQEALLLMPLAERDERLEAAIDEALNHYLQAETAWDSAYLAMQRQRLFLLLQPWLAEELRRGPFAVVSLEEKAKVTIGPLTFDVRYDRIDKVDGGFFLVDYKTGLSGTPAQWEDEQQRPEDPQLPLYAIQYEPGELKGLAFAKVRAGKERGWLGVQAEPGQLPSATARNTRDLDILIEEWRATLTQLAEDFHNGRTDVDPRHYPMTCKHCRQRLLCRIDPLTLATQPEDAAETPDA